jgi:hypothetical protein
MQTYSGVRFAHVSRLSPTRSGANGRVELLRRHPLPCEVRRNTAQLCEDENRRMSSGDGMPNAGSLDAPDGSASMRSPA